MSVIINPGYVPHREQLGAQLEYLRKLGHEPKAGEGLTVFLERLHDEEMILYVERDPGPQDAQFLRATLAQAEESGRLLVRAPRASLAPRHQTIADIPESERAYTITREEARDPRRYVAAKKAAQEAGVGSTPNIISG